MAEYGAQEMTNVSKERVTPHCEIFILLFLFFCDKLVFQLPTTCNCIVYIWIKIYKKISSKMGERLREKEHCDVQHQDEHREHDTDAMQQGKGLVVVFILGTIGRRYNGVANGGTKNTCDPDEFNQCP